MVHIALRPQLASVCRDDRTTDRESHAHALGLGSKEGLEEPVAVLRTDSGATVSHRDEHAHRILQRFRYDRQFAGPVIDALMASMPLIIRFSSTCCSWTRSASRVGGSAAK